MNIYQGDLCRRANELAGDRQPIRQSKWSILGTAVVVGLLITLFFLGVKIAAKPGGLIDTAIGAIPPVELQVSVID